MESNDKSQKDVFERFQTKLEELKETLPPLGRTPGTSCAALTFTNILDVLNLEIFESCYFNNLAVPFSGFGSYVNDKGFKGPCGTVSGAIAALGVIMGGQEELKRENVSLVFAKAMQFADKFEKKFGSVSCHDICGYDLRTNYKTYVKENIWEKKCCNFVLSAIELVMKLTRKDLKTKWQ
jgi:C_GCAxxG_C_C family probable redox protein